LKIKQEKLDQLNNKYNNLFKQLRDEKQKLIDNKSNIQKLQLNNSNIKKIISSMIKNGQDR